MMRFIGSIFAVVFTLATAHAWGQPVPGGAADLAKQVQALEMLVKRLHGYKAAVLAHEFENTRPGPPGQFQIGIVICPGEVLGLGNHCLPQNPDAAMLQTRFLTAADDRATLTFDATNSPDFAAMIDLLTNSSNDRIRLIAEYLDNQGNFLIGNATQSTERNRFFIEPQVSSGPAYVDLAGLDIDNITISIDRLRMDYDEGDDETDFTLRFRVFFGLAE